MIILMESHMADFRDFKYYVLMRVTFTLVFVIMFVITVRLILMSLYFVLFFEGFLLFSKLILYRFGSTVLG